MKKNSCIFIIILLLFFGIYCVFYKLTTNKLLNYEEYNGYKIIDEVKKDNNIIKISLGENGIYLSKDGSMPMLVSNTKDVMSAKVLKYGSNGKDLLMIRNDGTLSYLSINNIDEKVVIANHVANLDDVAMVYNTNSGMEEKKYYSILAKDKNGNVTDITEALIEINDNI